MVTDLMILGNFEPMMKLDGYWLLSDLAGVPNLPRERVKPCSKGCSGCFGGWVRAARPQASSFGQWSPKVRRLMIVYVALSVVIWPFLLLGMIPMVVGAITTYPALWQTALVAAGQAIRTHDFALLLAQGGSLFLPTLMLANVGFLLKLTWNRWRKARAAQNNPAAHAKPDRAAGLDFCGG